MLKSGVGEVVLVALRLGLEGVEELPHRSRAWAEEVVHHLRSQAWTVRVEVEVHWSRSRASEAAGVVELQNRSPALGVEVEVVHQIQNLA